jgi:serine/threonine protein kinase
MSLERYEMQSELGRGGFGVVYKARQLATGQPVAIKMMHRPRDTGDEAQNRHVARFEREMKLCAQLHHPNIVRLIDSGLMEDGRIYAVFEYVPGKTLANLLSERGALEPVEAQHLMLQILDALSCAHSQGMVHRDLKPHNVMVVATGARLNALVLDFGLGALVQGAELEAQSKLTGTYEVLGTPAYAAPEQLRGEQPTPASDLFSWALVFLECLTGARPIQGRTLQEILYQQLGPAPIPLPPALEAHPLGQILARLLNKDVQARGQLKGAKLLREVEACNLRGLRLHPNARGPSSSPGMPAVPGKDGLTHTWQAQVHPTPPEQAGGPPKQEGDRRWVTALCCTLTVSPTSPKQMDIEETDEFVRLGQQLCTEIGRSFGGSLGGVLGDQILLYFGLAAVHPESAQRAAQAALEILEGVRKRSAQLERQKQVRLDVRASLHAGLVVPRAPAQIVGTTPTTAAQLSARALPWEVVVSVGTAPLLQPRFTLEPMPQPQPPAAGMPEVLRLQAAQHPAPEPHPAGGQ